MKEVNKIFAKIPRGIKSAKMKVREIQKNQRYWSVSKKTDQTHFVLGVRSYNLFNKKNAVLAVLAGVLGGGMSSRLFKNYVKKWV